MKRFLSSLISVAILLSNTAFAEGSSSSIAENQSPKLVTIHVDETNEHVAGNIAVMEVRPEDEVALAREIAKQPNHVIFTSDSNDPVKTALDGEIVSIASGDQINNVSRFGKWKNRLNAGVDWMESNPKKFGLLIAIVPATAYGTYWYLLSSDYMVGAGAATLGYLYGTALTFFGKQWLKFCKYTSGKAVAGAMDSLVSVLGLKMSNRSRKRMQVRARRFGQILTAYSMNVGLMGAMMGIGGHFQLDWHTGATMMQLALYGAHDVVDYKTETLESRRARAVAVPIRIGGCSLTELFAALGVEQAELAIDVIVFSYSSAHIFSEQFKHYISRPIVKSTSKIAAGLKRIRAFRWGKKKNCSEYLKDDSKDLTGDVI